MNRNGFTLIELVVILVLIGIIAVLAAPRMLDVTNAKAGAFRHKLQADVRYVQNLAMTHNRRYRVYFNGNGLPTPSTPADGYIAVNDADGDTTWGEAGEVAADPSSSGNLSVTLNTGDYANVTISTGACGPPVSGGFVEFNSEGRPTTGSVAIAVCASGTFVGTVTITAETGAVN